MEQRTSMFKHGRDRHLMAAGDPLLRAYYERNVERLEELIEAKKSELERRLDDVNPLACLAAKDDRCDVLSLVYTIHGDMQIQNAERMRPLHLAVMYGSFEAMAFLVEKGMDVNEPYPNGDQLLHKACTTGEPDFIHFLLDAGADPNAKNASHNLPLHKACEEDCLEMAKLLIEKTEDVDAAGSENRTALHFAAANQSLCLIKLLLAYDANIDCYDKNGDSPMDIIIAMGNKNVIVGLAKFLCNSLPKECYNYQEMATSPEFDNIMNLIAAIDNEFHHPKILEQPKKVKDEEIKNIVERIRSEEKVDFLEFRKMVNTIVRGGFSNLIMENKLIDKFATSVCKQVLFREDDEMLKMIMYETNMWPDIAAILEENIFVLYEMSQEIGSTGMVALMHSEFFDDGEMDVDYFYGFVARLANLPQIENSKDRLHSKSRQQKDPLRTLAVWSIFSGRFELTEDLLKSEQFDIIPMGLLCANILRTLTLRKEIPTPTKIIMEDVADRCESVTVKVLKEICEMDTSENKIVTITSITEPMSRYSGRSTVDLAADGFSENFITMPSVQNALDIEWSKKLYGIHWFIMYVITVLGVIPYNIIVAIIIRNIQRKKEEERSKSIPEVHGVMEELEHLYLGCMDKPTEKGIAGIDEKGGSFGKDAKKSSLKKSLSVIKDSTDHDSQKKAKRDDKKIKYGKDSVVTIDSKDSKHKSDDEIKKSPRPSEPETNYFVQLFTIMNEFYTTPCIKFRYHVLMHVVFVIVYSVVIVAHFSYKINHWEIIVYVFLCGFILEELNEINKALQMGTLASYITDGWNIIDNLAIVLGTLGFCMRLGRLHQKDAAEWIYLFVDNYWWWTHVILAISCLLYWIRLLYISTVLESLGPKLKMIYVMIIRDFLPFFIILVIIMFGFGIAMHGLLFPNGYAKANPTPLDSFEIFQRMFKVTFYAMVGDYSLDLIEGNECAGKKMCPHPLGKILVLNVIMVVYIVITSVLLLNLIIALFSKTVEEIDKKSFALWQFERYQLVHEFNIRFPLPPPFNILGIFLNKLKGVFQAYKARGRDKYKGSKRFNTVSFVTFMVLQAFSLRRRRKDIVGEIEVEDPDKLIIEINNNVKQMNKRLDTLTKSVIDKKSHSHGEGEGHGHGHSH